MKSPKFFGKPKSLKLPILVRRVSGNSMMPTLPAGTIVVAHSWSRRFKPGDIVVLRHNNLEKIKRVKAVRPDGRVEVVGDYATESTDSRHFGPLPASAITARVIWPRR